MKSKPKKKEKKTWETPTIMEFDSLEEFKKSRNEKKNNQLNSLKIN